MTETQTTAAFSQGLINGSKVYRLPSSSQRVLITEPNHNCWWNKVKEQLQDLISLKIGWDGYQGEPVSFENANFALRVLEAICFDDTPTPQIVPGTGGDLQIEWHTHVTEIELHILAPNNVHAWISSPQTEPEGEEFALTIDFSIVAGLIRRMTEYTRDRTAAA
jgi:hypothetical protein